MTVNPPKHVAALDGLRFLAAGAVMFSHMAYQLWPVPDWSNVATSTWFLTHTANFGMTLFFVLSGFVIHWNYRISIQQPGGMRAFFIARFARLYPLFLVVFVIGATGEIADRGHFERIILTTPFYLTFVSSWWYWQVDGIHIYDAYSDPAIGVLWSLATEAFFYALYPFLASAAARLSRKASLTALAASGALAAILALEFFVYNPEIGSFSATHFGASYSGFLFWLGYNSPWMRLPEFLTGLFAAQLFLSGFRLRPFTADGVGILSCVGIVAGTIVIFLTKSSLSMVDTTVFAVLFGSLCLAAATGQSTLGRLLSTRAMVLGGEASYSLYLLHSPILVFFARHGLLNASHPGRGMLLAGAFVIIVSRSSYVWFERPAQRLLRARYSPVMKII